MKYKLLRRKRKSLSIVIKNGIVTVLAPKRLALSYIEAFVDEKKAWIEKNLDQHKESYGKFEDILKYKTIMLLGRVYSIKVEDSVKRFKLEGEYLLCPKKLFEGTSCKRHKNNQFILALKQFVRRFARVELLKRLEKLAVQHSFVFSKFSLSDAKTKWGSCDKQGKIMLNLRLVCLDEELIEYVILHELCHTRFCNHSKQFWEEVSKICPSFKPLRKRLKENSILTNYLRTV